MQDAFWISTAFVMGGAMHVVLTSAYLLVFGPAKSLYGPPGSMAQACEVMRNEINEIFGVFMMTMITFALTFFFCVWVIFGMLTPMHPLSFIHPPFCFAVDYPSAWFGTFVFFFGAIGWYIHCKQIHNSFRYDASTSTAQFTNDEEGAVRRIRSVRDDSDVTPFRVLMEGFTSFVDTVKGKTVTKRRYLVLESTGDLFFYKSKDKYLSNRFKPCNKRPIDSRDYKAIASTNDDLFQITLEPKDKSEGDRSWTFLFDNSDELESWRASFTAMQSPASSS